jgi:hypothetical protein
MINEIDDIETIALNIAWLKRYKNTGVVKIRGVGICGNAKEDNKTWLVAKVSESFGGEYVINDRQSCMDAYGQYHHHSDEWSLHTGQQLLLRKEYAQTCVDYLNECIRI